MSVEMPDPLPLEMPPGDPAAVDDLVRDVAGAAYRLAVIGDELAGPAVAAPGWLGADAAAAAAQLTRVAALTRAAGDALVAAAGRLSTHGELLRETRRAVGVLREAQDEDFRAAWQRLGAAEDPQLAVLTGSPTRVGVVAEVVASEERRRRRHALLLEEVADDAAATARALAEAGRPVGGTGRPGDGERVLAHLAAELPGWGDPEMTRRGRVLAQALLETDDRARLSGDAVHPAAHPAFATALIRELGVESFGLLLRVLGSEPGGPDHPVAAVLAAALGAAVPGGRPRDGVAAVLGATYVRADERTGAAAAAAGMAAVLLAGTGSRGVRAATAGEWARQLLVREHVQEAPAGTVPLTWSAEAADPVAVAVRYVAGSGASEVAAGLLGDERVWEASLARTWGDGGAALGDLVAEAGREAGPAGDRAVRLGLETIGAGLVEGAPSDRAVDRGVVAAVTPALGGAVATHVDVVTGALVALSADGGGERTEDRLRGLGHLTADRPVAAAVDRALAEWAAAQPHDLTGSSRADPLPAVAVPAAYLAVQEYGQRLAHALDGFELQEEAETRARWWDRTAGLALSAASLARYTPLGVAADIVGAYAPIVLGLDGTFEQDPDRGLRFDAEDAGARALATPSPDLAARAAAVESQAEAAYRRTAGRLGVPEAPVSGGPDWAGATADLVTGGMGGLLTDDPRDRAGRGGGVPAGLLPGRR